MKACFTWRFTARVVMAAVLLVVALIPEAPVQAQSGPSEYDLKAAFVFQFLAYVTWPESKSADGSPILIGIVGADELARNLTELAGTRGVGTRSMEIRRLGPDADPALLHLLFVADEYAANADELLRRAVASGVVTVTETLPRPPASVINFEIIDSRIRFDVALGLARANGMDVSARLLQVALRVMEQP